MRYFQLMAITVSAIALMSTANAASPTINSNNSVGVKASAAGVKAHTKSSAGLGLKTMDDYSSQEGENDMGNGTYDSSNAVSADTGYDSNVDVNNSASANVAGRTSNTVNGAVDTSGHLATDLNNTVRGSTGGLLNGSTNARVGVGAKANGSLLGR